MKIEICVIGVATCFKLVTFSFSIARAATFIFSFYFFHCLRLFLFRRQYEESRDSSGTRWS